MLLPDPQLPPPLPSVLAQSASQSKIDKAVLDREITRYSAQILPRLLARAEEIALSPESKDSDALSAIHDFFDRSAGKATQVIQHEGSMALFTLPPEEVTRRLNALRGEASGRDDI